MESTHPPFNCHKEKQTRSISELLVAKNNLLKDIARDIEVDNVLTEENSNNQFIQSDICRCCLLSPGTFDLMGSYVSESGESEVFYIMLRFCFDITLSSMSEWGSSRFICDSCAASVRQAFNFKQQVLQAEKNFTKYQGVTSNINLSLVKTEENDDEINSHCFNDAIDITAVKTEIDPVMDSYDSITEDFTENSNNLKTAPSVAKIPKIKHNYKTRMKKTQILDSTEVIDDLKIEKDGISQSDVNNVKFKASKTKVVKHLSHRSRMRLTCDTVLKYTTACPFKHRKTWFQCFFCIENFIQMSELRAHTLEYHDKKDVDKLKYYPQSLQIDITHFNCQICDSILTDVKHMTEHFSSVHKKAVYKECLADYKINRSPFHCHICGEEFHVFRMLTTHINEHCANCICDVCGKPFLNSKRLKVHKRTHEFGEFPCSKCGKILNSKTSIINHMESHSNRVLKCQICLKPMKHYNDRIKHMSEEHDITHNFKCKICGREYNIKQYLATHMRQTHGVRNKKCMECDMAFVTNHGLKKHMLKHSGVKAFSCTKCSKSYARSYTLKEHMRGHEGEGTFIEVK